MLKYFNFTKQLCFVEVIVLETPQNDVEIFRNAKKNRQFVRIEINNNLRVGTYSTSVQKSTITISSDLSDLKNNLNLPIRTVQDMIITEEILNSHRGKIEFIYYITKVSDLEDSMRGKVRAILNTVYHPGIALYYNYTGTHGKKQFSSTNSSQLIIKLMQTLFPGKESLDSAQTLIKNWLKYQNDQFTRIARLKIRNSTELSSKQKFEENASKIDDLVENMLEIEQ